MIRLNLLDGGDFKTFNFPAGEAFIRVQEPIKIAGQDVELIAEANTSELFMRTLLAISAIQCCGVKSLNVYMKYLPFARQDRVCSPGDPDSANLMINILANTLINGNLYTFDMHSDRFVKVKNIVSVAPEFDKITTAMDMGKDFILVYPDAGAQKRYSYNHPADKTIYFEKMRNPKTGEIFGMQPKSMRFHLDYENFKEVLVVDDICDGGKTFTEIAKFFTATPQLKLFVAHGLFTKGLDVLKDAGYKSVGYVTEFDSSHTMYTKKVL